MIGVLYGQLPPWPSKEKEYDYAPRPVRKTLYHPMGRSRKIAFSTNLNIRMNLHNHGTFVLEPITLIMHTNFSAGFFLKSQRNWTLNWNLRLGMSKAGDFTLSKGFPLSG